MALFTKKDFASQCHLTTGNLSNYVKLGKVVYSGDYIDDSIELNRVFRELRQAKKGLPKSDKPETVKPDPGQPVLKSDTKPRYKEPKAPNVSSPQVKTQLATLITQLKEADVEKRLLENENLRLKIEKARGEVIPVELVKPLVLQNNQAFVTAFLNAADEVIRRFSKKKDLSLDEQATMRGELVDAINAAASKAVLMAVKAAEGIAKEFAGKKGVGEREI